MDPTRSRSPAGRGRRIHGAAHIPPRHWGIVACRRLSRNVSRDAICLACAPTTRSYFGSVDTKLRLTCSGCSEGLPKSAFDKKAMWQRIDAGNTAFLKCIDCMSDDAFCASRPWLSKSRAFTCNGPLCSEKAAQPREAFARHTQMSRNLAAWKCDSCQRPACEACGVQPPKPLTYPWSPPYTCLDCLYPPCAGCGTTRPAKERKTMHQRKRWHCSGCSQKEAAKKDAKRSK